MNNILINGISAKGGGGKSLLVNFLTLLMNKKENGDTYFVVVPLELKTEYQKYVMENIHIIFLPSSSLDLLKYNFYYANRLCMKHKISILINFADVIVLTSIRQIYLFDWSYAIYPDSQAWRRMSVKDRIVRSIKLYLIKRCITLPLLILAQTQTAKDRLKKYYNIANIDILPNAVSLDSLSGGECKDFNLPKNKIKLLYLTRYYTHKNIEIFLPLAELIRVRNLPYILVITIEPSQHKNAKKILELIKKEKFEDVIVNTGEISMSNVPSLYQQTDALLIPTLLESFSGTYIEAMYHKKPIFTSDIDFARDVCQDAAFYFNPIDVEDILNTVIHAFNNPDLIKTSILNGIRRLSEYSSWEEVFYKMMGIIKGDFRR
jgi:glycosyltransferase involved in cell wall biosynthesis